jgi:hypothetical protein
MGGEARRKWTKVFMQRELSERRGKGVSYFGAFIGVGWDLLESLGPGVCKSGGLYAGG